MPADSADLEIPRSFISYAWTDADYQARVVDFATRLRNRGIDVLLDVWYLRPGQDKYHFMEGMVRDPTIGFVLVLCNSKYVEKANERLGGVGDETLIITPEVYANAQNTKFIPVVMERDENGIAFVPHYLKSRIYIDLSSEQVFYEQFEFLLRLLHGAPEFPLPPLGPKPKFLEAAAATGSSTLPQLRRALAAIEQGKPIARVAAGDHLEAIAAEVLLLQPSGTDDPLDEQLVEAIRRSKHMRDETLDLLQMSTAALPPEATEQMLATFFQKLLIGCYPESGGTEETLEAVQFVTMELFLYVFAGLLNSERLDVLGTLLAERFIVHERGCRVAASADTLHFTFQCLEDRRKRRLNSNRTSVLADLLHERADRTKIPFERIQETQFLLYLRSRFAGGYGWWPTSLVYRNSAFPSAFDIFISMGSKRRDSQLQVMLGASDRDALRGKLDGLDPHHRALRFNQSHMPMSVARLMNLEER